VVNKKRIACDRNRDVETNVTSASHPCVESPNAIVISPLSWRVTALTLLQIDIFVDHDGSGRITMTPRHPRGAPHEVARCAVAVSVAVGCADSQRAGQGIPLEEFMAATSTINQNLLMAVDEVTELINIAGVQGGLIYRHRFVGGLGVPDADVQYILGYS